MHIDFSQLKPTDGPAIFFIHDGQARSELKFGRLIAEVERKTKKQCVLIDGSQQEGRDLLTHFHLGRGNHIILVTSHNQPHHNWSDGEHFDAGHIAHAAEQIR